MDLREYFQNIRRNEKVLETEHPDHVVYITSLKNSSKNSVPGTTMSATPYNAARGIVDETHRVATDEEIKAFFAHQEANRVDNQKSEARKKKEIVVVMDRDRVSDFPEGSKNLVESAMAASKGSRTSVDD